MMVIAEWSLPARISTHRPFIVFSAPCTAEEGSDRAALVDTWPGSTHPNEENLVGIQHVFAFQSLGMRET